MHTIMLGPQLLVTDGMIHAGAKYLLQQSDIRIDEYQQWTERTDQPIPCFKEPTHIVILGTPWLWDRCWESAKFKSVVHFLDRWPNAKVLFFGIGSCYPLNKFDRMINNALQNIENLNALFGRGTVIVRDTLAHQVLTNSILLPCPAYYGLWSAAATGPRMDTIIWYDPTIGISNVDYKPGSELLEAYLSEFETYYDCDKHSVYCVDNREKELAMKIGLPEPIALGDFMPRAASILLRSDTILSGRVHLSVPAYGTCKDIKLIAVDSRAKVLHDVQSKQIMEPVLALAKYKEILDAFKLL